MLTGTKSLIKKAIFKVLKPPTKYVYNSYAQAGEDVIIKFLFDQIGLQRPTYLELGVFYPDHYNNTYLFYTRGSRGVCVEADETLIPNIRAVRNEDTVLNIGVSDGAQREADFYIFDDRGLNTFSKEEAESRSAIGTVKVIKTVKVPLQTVNEIIEGNFSSYPHFLSIDIEGLDLAVLESLDFSRFPIPVVCVETCTYSENHIKPKDRSIEAFMHSIGYFTYADTYINTIFVNKEWFANPK